jgi:uncharacterized phosphosugar-binding protein
MDCQTVIAAIPCNRDGRIYIAGCVHEHVAKISICDRHAALFTRPRCTICEEADGHECIVVLTLREGE